MIRSGLWWSIGMIIASIGVSVYGTYQIPSDMVLPVHWSLDGQADQYMQRDTVMVSIPAVMVLMTALFAAIPFIDPRTNNVRRSAGLYYASWFGGLGVLLIIQTCIVLSAANGDLVDPKTIFILACLLTLMIGNYMAKSRSSWFIGLRTPWSLTSERAWISANRATGGLFVLTAIMAGLAAFFIEEKWGFTILGVGVLASTIAGTVISYDAWRNDPKGP